MRYSNYIYKLLTILVFGFCSASQFVVAEALTPQERTLISDFTSGINDFSLITEETCGSGSTQSFTYPILPSVPADVASAMEKALEYKEKEALANVAAVVLNYASKVRENYNTNLFLNWNNPLTKAYYRIKELIYGEVVNAPETAKITSDNILYTQYRILGWLGEHSQLEAVIQPKLDEDRLRHCTETEQVLTQLINEYPCPNTYTEEQAKGILKDYVINSPFSYNEDLQIIRCTETPPSNVVKALWIMFNTNDKDYLAYIAYYYFRYFIKFSEDYPEVYVGSNYGKKYHIMIRVFVTEFPEIAEGIIDYDGALQEWVREHRDKLGEFNLLDEALVYYNNKWPIKTIEEIREEINAN